MSMIFRSKRRFRAALRWALLALAVAAPAAPDTITLRNGGVIKCKVVKETKELVKVRMPHRGKIVTTFLSRGTIESIDKLSDAENRAYFQGRGVRNPAKSFEPVYYSGGRTASATTGGKPGAARGKAAVKAKERGIAARQKASEERAKERSKSSRYGDKSKTASSSSSGSSSSTGIGTSTSPSTTGGATTSTTASFGGSTAATAQ